MSTPQSKCGGAPPARSVRPFEVISVPGSQPAPYERVYVFHGSASTQLLGADRLVTAAQKLLAAAGIDPHVSPAVHTDIVARPYTNESLQDPILDAPSAWLRSHTSVSELSVQLPAQEFWDRLNAGSWATWSEQWPAPAGSPLFPPRTPDWLMYAPRWELDPLAPALGPAAPGGWIWAPAPSGSAHESDTGVLSNQSADTALDLATDSPASGEQPPWVGLFQLTDVESFWVLSTAERLDQVVKLCEQLSSTHSAFSWLTGYFDPRDVLGSLRLPMECAPELEFALTERGYSVDVWW
ncbi:hypothetical protein [Kocuria atrinae]|uniref:DUF4279 domain-containing protein n=1 Tax=Kocuria atrinae TaxID=592377 RepID=A0ABN2XGV7_9MICC